MLIWHYAIKQDICGLLKISTWYSTYPLLICTAPPWLWPVFGNEDGTTLQCFHVLIKVNWVLMSHGEWFPDACNLLLLTLFLIIPATYTIYCSLFVTHVSSSYAYPQLESHSLLDGSLRFSKACSYQKSRYTLHLKGIVFHTYRIQFQFILVDGGIF